MPTWRSQVLGHPDLKCQIQNSKVIPPSTPSPSKTQNQNSKLRSPHIGWVLQPRSQKQNPNLNIQGLLCTQSGSHQPKVKSKTQISNPMRCSAHIRGVAEQKSKVKLKLNSPLHSSGQVSQKSTQQKTPRENSRVLWCVRTQCQNPMCSPSKKHFVF